MGVNADREWVLRRSGETQRSTWLAVNGREAVVRMLLEAKVALDVLDLVRGGCVGILRA